MLDMAMRTVLFAVAEALRTAHVTAINVGGDGGGLQSITIARDGRVGMGSKGITVTLIGSRDEPPNDTGG